MPYLAPSLHCEFRMSILEFNVKRAPDISSLFYFEKLKFIYVFFERLPCPRRLSSKIYIFISY